jgi:DNA-binding transcriptional ArsR family regulator
MEVCVVNGEPDVASVAALIGDPSRAAILARLADGRALPAGELAWVAGLSLSGASAQLARLTQGGLLAMEREGRHRYYRLAGPHVAAALEGLALLASAPRRACAHSPATEALRRARTCYDHLAGELGVTLAQVLEERDLLVPAGGKQLEVTVAGESWFAQVLGIETACLSPGRHGIARRCLDWTERRHHIGGPLGAALLQRCCALGWLTQRAGGTRAIQLSRQGSAELRRTLGILL